MCFVTFPAFFQLCTYTTFEYLVRILFHVTVYVNVTILRKYSGNVRACASSRYQAVSLLPRGLGTRLVQRVLKFLLTNYESLRPEQETVVREFFLKRQGCFCSFVYGLRKIVVLRLFVIRFCSQALAQLPVACSTVLQATGSWARAWERGYF